MSVQSGGKRLRLSELNEHLTCKLCGGYYRDATTVTKCLHSFCKICIVRYLENSKNCPICESQIHKNKPLLGIKLDHLLQDIVYKVVPNFYENEMRSRQEYYSKNPEEKKLVSPEDYGEPLENYLYMADESLSLSLEYYNPGTINETANEQDTLKKSLPRRYLCCPAAVTVFHLQKLIRAKYGLTEAHRVDIMYEDELLHTNYTLMDLMYIYHWKKKVPLHLSYRIFESSPKRLKLSDDNNDFRQSLSNSNIESLDSHGEDSVKREWKEVQLKISETGVMSVTDISNSEIKKNSQINELSDIIFNADNVNVVEDNKKTIKKEARLKKGSDQATNDAGKLPDDKASSNKNKIQLKSKEMELQSINQQDLSIELLKSSNEHENELKANKLGKDIRSGMKKIQSDIKKNKSDSGVSESKGKTKQKGKANKDAVSTKLPIQPKNELTDSTDIRKSPLKKISEDNLKIDKTNLDVNQTKINKLSISDSSKLQANLTKQSGKSLSQCLDNLTPSTETLASIGLHVSTNISSQSQISNNNNNKAIDRLIKNNSISEKLQKTIPQIGKDTTCINVTTHSNSVGRFDIQTPSMSIYSISNVNTKKNTFNTPSSKPASGKSNVDTGSHQVPPCPDAIPISLMKPVRKQDLPKGTVVNEICAKISSSGSGSKINDICAKIGENSKEKNKLPDLVKISKNVQSFAENPTKHIPNIPNIPTFIPTSTTVTQSINAVQSSIQKSSSQKKHSQVVGYKTLHDPPKSWNPTLSKNNYVAAKNQAKEIQNQTYGTSEGTNNSMKPIPSKPAKIFNTRNNTPRVLGNPSLGVKPMYNVVSESPPIKEKDNSQNSNSPKKKSTMNVMKIDPKTLSPISTTSSSTTSSPLVSPPPYSPSARNYQNTPYSRDVGRTSNSSLTSRNSPINMLSTNPFIPSHTPNTNPRLIYMQFPSTFTDTEQNHRLQHYLNTNPLIRSPIGVSPQSAYHSSLPPSVNKLYQRSNYIPSTIHPPTIQRMPPTSHSTTPKSPKTTSPNSSKEKHNSGQSPSKVDNVALQLANKKSTSMTNINAFDLTRSELLIPKQIVSAQSNDTKSKSLNNTNISNKDENKEKSFNGDLISAIKVQEQNDQEKCISTEVSSSNDTEKKLANECSKDKKSNATLNDTKEKNELTEKKEDQSKGTDLKTNDIVQIKKTDVKSET